ncbi:MAG: putative zinc-binding protein [Caldisphaeraceae archaeon]|nr:putative zinc-binding protein [Caldisphaeraceae archaeon]
MVTSQYKYSLLPSCSKYAPNLIIVATCDSASSTGQVDNEVARILTKSYPSLVRVLPSSGSCGIRATLKNIP